MPPGLMTPGCQGGTRKFFSLCSETAGIWRSLRLFLIGAFWGDWNLGEIRAAGACQIKMGSTFPYGTLLINLTGCFFPWTDRADSAESRGLCAGMADGDCVGIFRRIHHIFELRMETAKMPGGREWLWATTYVAAERGVGYCFSVAGIRLANPVLRSAP